MLDFKLGQFAFDKDENYWINSNLNQLPKELQDKLIKLNVLSTRLRFIENKDMIEKTKISIKNLIEEFQYTGCNPVYLGEKIGFFIIPSTKIELSRLNVFDNIYSEERDNDPIYPPIATDQFESLINSAITVQFNSQLNANAKPFTPQNNQKTLEKSTESLVKLYNDLKKSR